VVGMKFVPYLINLSCMKAIFPQSLLLLLLAAVLVAPASAQLDKRQRKDLQKDIKKKAIKEARREARAFQKQGYVVAPGSLAMDKMLEYTWYKLLERDDEGSLVYLSSDGNAVAETRTAAEMQALEIAKLNLAGQLETQIRALVQANIGNMQLNAEEAASVTKVLTAAKNVIAVRLENVDPSFKIHRVLKNKNVEVNIKLLYNREKALYQAKNSVRMKLEEELGDLHGKLDKLMGLDEKEAKE
jgi:hypothetical protein